MGHIYLYKHACIKCVCDTIIMQNRLVGEQIVLPENLQDERKKQMTEVDWEMQWYIKIKFRLLYVQTCAMLYSRPIS